MLPMYSSHSALTFRDFRKCLKMCKLFQFMLEIIFGSIFNIYQALWFYALCCTTGAGGGGASARTLKNIDLVKSRAKSLKICGNLGKISENLHKIPENLSKPLKIWAKMAPKITWRVFFGGHFLWSFFRASLGEFGNNPSHPQKFACSYTYVLHYHRFTDFWSCICESPEFTLHSTVHRSSKALDLLFSLCKNKVETVWNPTFYYLVKPVEAITAYFPMWSEMIKIAKVWTAMSNIVQM